MFTRLALRTLVPTVQHVTRVIAVNNVKQCMKFSRFTPIKPYPIEPIHITGRCYSSNELPPTVVVDYDYVRKCIGDSNKLIVDVREPEEVKEHGMIPNSINIPLNSLTSALTAMTEKEFQERYGRKKPTEDTPIVFYCMIGKRSGMAQQNALNLGYKNVMNYLGSWTEWAAKTEAKNEKK